MLELRPICEHCATELPPASTEAMICSFECTFCRPCVDDVLGDVCPNCGGGFVPRPIRPAGEWMPGASVTHAPPTTERHHRPIDAAAHSALRERIGGRGPHER